MTQFLRWRPDATTVLAAAVNAARTKGVAVLPLTSVRLLSPVRRPGKILGVGLNYPAHAAEAASPHAAGEGNPLPSRPGPASSSRHPPP